MQDKGENFSGHKTYSTKVWRETDDIISDCQTVDNIYNYSYTSAIKKFPSIETLFENEVEFNERKTVYEFKNTA